MSGMQQLHGISIHSQIFLALLGVVPGLVLAQGASAEVPENARAKSYGVVDGNVIWAIERSTQRA